MIKFVKFREVEKLVHYVPLSQLSLTQQNDTPIDALQNAATDLQLLAIDSLYAKYCLASCYAYGFGVERDAKKAIELSEFVIQQGDHTAGVTLGYIYAQFWILL